MSCWRRTSVLRIPVSVLGFKSRSQWKAFTEEHSAVFGWDIGSFQMSLSDDYPPFCALEDSPDAPLDRRDPAYPDIVPGPFLDYCLEEVLSFSHEDSPYGHRHFCSPLNDQEKKRYLPLFQSLFPSFTLEDMAAVRRCQYTWYDGSEAPYLYSELDELESRE